MLAIVVRNLLTNAVKFTPAGGEIALKVVSHKSKVMTKGLTTYDLPLTTVTISDNGIGMSAETLQNLFKIDKQTSRTGTSGEQGSGLGLIVCKELVEKNGGTLTVESTEGKGSTFRFTVVKENQEL
jgi:signal transduction histidine kinase